MKEVTLEYCNDLMKKYEKFKETAEPHMFPLLLLYDTKLKPAHKDLNAHWDKEHGAIFIRSMENIVFPKLGVTL